MRIGTGGVLTVASLALYLTAAQVGAAGMASNPCSQCGCCDCDGSGDVTINELIAMVGIALGTEPFSVCPATGAECCQGDQVNNIIECVGFALIGSCPETPPTPTPTPTAQGVCLLDNTTCSAAYAIPIQGQNSCCAWFEEYDGLGTIVWCASENFDPATGHCNVCVNPCVGAPCESDADCGAGFACTSHLCCPARPPGSCVPTPQP